MAARVKPQTDRFIPTHAGNTCRSSKWPCTCAVHPHSRGEHPQPMPPKSHPVRFIPTHAGNTCSAVRDRDPPAVHPHSRGEHFDVCNLRPAHRGSSPLTRGTHRHRAIKSIAIRFIPTHAGNTLSFLAVPPAPTVHPHSRGEHWVKNYPAGLHCGSSPLTRGTPPRWNCVFRVGRFIPTHAGNTPAFVASACRIAVHPHSRGEHFFRAGRRVLNRGSSPLTRGTQPGESAGQSPGRFIPTHAGNTHFYLPTFQQKLVHPHSRGEHRMRLAGDMPQRGSSPLTRGTLGERSTGISAGRFIPTHAGNTPPATYATRMRPVHPHSRGEHFGDCRHRCRAGGSSPLTRGTPVRCPRRASLRAVHPHSRGEHSIGLVHGSERRRFIPTHAGNTPPLR